jgi:aspartyl-tRNA(Asn)/glutamyl-tRNA(Gln) amidotransferase subunit B
MVLKPVIGLEVHVQLGTRSKMFCSCPADPGAQPNENICPVCTGQPGALPVINRKAVELTVLTGIALECSIAERSSFARKNYFYPDMPKNYQISQYESPLCSGGCLEIKNGQDAKKIGITRIHLEEDAGKLLHAIGARELDYSLVDCNRAGVPLMEIVSEPQLASPDEAYAYLCAIKSVLEYLGVSDCSMEKGSLRCDANISVGEDGQLGVKAELKNMNSFKGVREALAYEIKRQLSVIAGGGKVVQETRMWDEGRGVTEQMRRKEEAHDYRYFPDPDLVPVEMSAEAVRAMRAGLPELPDKRKSKFISAYGLSEYDAGVLTARRELADYFEASLKTLAGKIDPRAAAKQLSNWITTELLGRLNASGGNITDSPVAPENLAGLIGLMASGVISGRIAKDVFDEMFSSGKAAEAIVKDRGLVQINDESAVSGIIEAVLAENPKAVSEYRSGKLQALGSLVGQVMKKTQGKANPQLVNKILKEKLKL